MDLPTCKICESAISYNDEHICELCIILGKDKQSPYEINNAWQDVDGTFQIFDAEEVEEVQPEVPFHPGYEIGEYWLFLRDITNENNDV